MTRGKKLIDSSTDGVTNTNTNTQSTSREDSFSKTVHEDNTLSSDTTRSQTTSDSSATTDGTTSSKGGGSSNTKTTGDNEWSATIDGTIGGRRLLEDGAQPDAPLTTSTTSTDLVHLRRLLVEGTHDSEGEATAVRTSLVTTVQFFSSLGARPNQQVMASHSLAAAAAFPDQAHEPATETGTSDPSVDTQLSSGGRKLGGFLDFVKDIGGKIVDAGKSAFNGVKDIGQGIVTG